MTRSGQLVIVITEATEASTWQVLPKSPWYGLGEELKVTWLVYVGVQKSVGLRGAFIQVLLREKSNRKKFKRVIIRK